MPVNAGQNLQIDATGTSDLIAGAGAVAFGNDIGIAGSFAANDLTNTTLAQTQGAAVSATSIALEATATQQFATLSDGGSGAALDPIDFPNFAGSVNLDNLSNDVEASLGDGSTANSTGDVLIQATSSTTVFSDAGATSAIANGFLALGLALDLEFLNDTVNASIGTGNVNAGGNISVFASAAETIDSISASLAQDLQAGSGGAGAVSSVSLDPDVQSFANGMVTTPDNLFLNAANTANLVVSAGAAAGGNTAGVGISAANSNINRTVKAFVGAGANVHTGGGGTPINDPGGSSFGGNGLSIHAATTDNILSFAAGVADASQVAVEASAVVNTMSSDTEAYIGTGAIVTSAQLVEAKAEQATTILSVAGSYASAPEVGVGAAGDVETLNRTIKAYIASSANVNAQGNVTLTANSQDQLDSIVGGTAGGGQLTIAGSASALSPTTTTLAYIDQGATVFTPTNVAVAAESTATITTQVGASTFSSTLGVGLSNTAIFNSGDTEAYIAQGANVTAQANGAAIVVPSGEQDSGGNDLTQSLDGLSLSALTREVISPATAGSANQPSGAGLAGSATFTTLSETTKAHIDPGAIVNQSLAGAGPDQVVSLVASDITHLTSFTGDLGAGGLVGIGAGADAASVTKDTEAFIAGNVQADQDVLVRALSSEQAVSISGTAEVDSAINLAGAASIYTLDVTTKAYLDNGATVFAQGNVLVSANDDDQVNLLDDLSGASALASVGGALGIATVNRVTEAYVGAATVDALGNGPGVDAADGTFTVNYAPDSGGVGDVAPPGIDFIDNILIVVLHTGGLINLTDVSPVPSDPALSQVRTVTPNTQTVNGLAVSAVSTGAVKNLTKGFGAAFVASPELSAAADVVNTQTAAFLAASAQVNQHPSGAATDQSVLVAAGSDFFHLGIAGNFSAAGVASVGPSIDAVLIKNTTTASIGASALVSAQGDVVVQANATEYVVSVSAGAAGSVFLGIAPSAALVTVNNQTLAFIDQGATVDAGGNVLLSATDTTHSDILTGSFGAGFLASAGTSLGAALITKDTEAWIGANATVNAQANSPAGIEVYSGDTSNGFATESIHGVGVQATSSENTVTMAGSGSAAFGVGVAASIPVDIILATTKAHIDPGASVNQSAGAASDQTVNVAAADTVSTLGMAVNLIGGALAAAGGVDLGIVRNDTEAYTGKGAKVSALQDVDVLALSSKLDQSFVGGFGVAVAGIVGSVSVYSIGAPLSSDATDLLGSVDGSVQSYVDDQIQSITQGTSGVFSSILNAYAGALGSPAQAAAASLGNQAPTGAVSTAVNNSNPSTGTAAYVDGSVVSAGRDVNIEANDQLHAVIDTSFTFAFALTSVPVSLSIDAALLTTHSDAAAYVFDGAMVSAGHDVNVLAAGNNLNDVAATVADSDIANTVTAYVDGAKVIATDVVTLTATPTSTIKTTSRTLGIGLFNPVKIDDPRIALSNIANVTDVHVSDGADVEGAQGVTLAAHDTSSITSQAEAGAYAKYVGVAPSFATNNVANSVKDYVDNAMVNSSSGAAGVDANETANILSIAAAGNLFGTVSVAAAVALNKTSDTVDAHVANGAIVSAPGRVGVTAENASTITAVGGTVAGFVGAVSFGATGGTNQIGDTTTAYLDHATATSTGDNVVVQATSTPTLKTLTAGGAGANTVAVGGAVSLNTETSTTDAHIADGSTVTGLGVQVAAMENGGIDALAGAASGAGTVSVGAAVATNTLGDTTSAAVDGSTVRATSHDVQVTATSTPVINSITATGSGAGTVAGNGAVSLNTLDDTVDAHAAGGATLIAAGNVGIAASENAGINALAGAVSGAGTVSVGASVATNDIGDTLKAYADGSSLNAMAGNVTVGTSSQSTIESLTVGGAGAGTAAAGGSVALDQIHNSLDAYAADGATLTASGAVQVTSSDTPTIDGLAGGVAGAAAAAIGAALATNDIASTVTAYADGAGTQLTGSNSVVISASSQGSLETITVGGAGADGFALGGSVSLNHVRNTLDAHVSGGAAVDSPGAVSVTATDTPKIQTLAGGLAGAAGAAIGAALATNDIASTITAYVDGATVTSTGSTVTVSAASTSSLEALTVGGAGAAGFAAGAAVSLNSISNTVDAHVNGGSSVSAPGAVSVTATDAPTIQSLAGGVAGAAGAAIGAAIATNDIGSRITAYVDGATVTSTGSTVTVSAASTSSLEALTVGGGGAAGFAAGGSVSLNQIANTLDADVRDGATVAGAGGVGVSATDSPTFKSLAGGVAGAAGAAIGAGVATTTTGGDVTAYVDGATVSSPGSDVTVDATSTPTVNTVTLGGAGAAFFASGGSVSKTTLGDTTDAHISDGAVVTAAGSIRVGAVSSPKVDVEGGALSGAIAAAGAGVAVANLGDQTNATVTTGAKLSAGNEVDVTAAADIPSFTVNGYVGGGGIVSLDAVVATISSTNNATAGIESGAAVQKAGAVNVHAETASPLQANGFGFSVGIVAIGAVVTSAEENGTTQATVNGATIGSGPGQQVGSLNVSASSSETVSAKGTAAGGGDCLG